MADITGKSPQVAADFPVKGLHVGMNWVYGQYSLTATLSGSDKIQFVKVPDGARIAEVILTVSGNVADGKISVGTSDDHDQFIASATIAGANVYRINTAAGVGAKLDVSDDATTRYTIIQAKYSDSTSFSGSSVGTLRLGVGYTLDQEGS